MTLPVGLKGSLNEYELDLLRQRSLEGRQAKAKRGERQSCWPSCLTLSKVTVISLLTAS
jgi:DNA invertase Pin-like site-specific DNA recombinase